jgi:hypothetical protein
VKPAGRAIEEACIRRPRRIPIGRARRRRGILLNISSMGTAIILGLGGYFVIQGQTEIGTGEKFVVLMSNSSLFRWRRNEFSCSIVLSRVTFGDDRQKICRWAKADFLQGGIVK